MIVIHNKKHIFPHDPVYAYTQTHTKLRQNSHETVLMLVIFSILFCFVWLYFVKNVLAEINSIHFDSHQGVVECIPTLWKILRQPEFFSFSLNWKNKTKPRRVYSLISCFSTLNSLPYCNVFNSLFCLVLKWNKFYLDWRLHVY